MALLVNQIIIDYNAVIVDKESQIMSDSTQAIKSGLKQALLENAAVMVLSVLALLTLLWGMVYAPKPVTWDSLKVIHDSSVRQHLYLLIIFYLCIYGVSVLIAKNRLVAYAKHVICYQHIFASIILVICYTLLFLSFCFFKNSIPYINFYSWDNVLIKLDWLLLFKHHPWVVVKSLVPNFEMIEVYNYIYLSWIPINSLILFWQQITINRALRIQYLTSLMSTWLVLGSWCAVLFSSVGPCFYSFFYDGSPDIIRVFTAHVEPIDLGLLTSIVKKGFLSNYFNESFTIGYGISAFPSLHVATTVINVLAITKRFKKLAIFGWAYVFLIMLSCIYIGFHYLSDCIFGMLGAIVIWKLTAKLYASSWYNNWLRLCQ